MAIYTGRTPGYVDWREGWNAPRTLGITPEGARMARESAWAPAYRGTVTTRRPVPGGGTVMSGGMQDLEESFAWSTMPTRPMINPAPNTQRMITLPGGRQIPEPEHIRIAREQSIWERMMALNR